jgi:aryl-alcohol dehydrogenase-like predicted oxidoreductase
MHFIEAKGASIPAIGLGTWELRGRTCARLVEQALKLGYRHIDTAQIYENERDVGDGLRASGIRRDEVFVTTKVWTTHFAPNDLERSTRESLARLRLSNVDLLLLHWPNPHVPLAETLGALAHVKRLGLSRHIGISNFTVALIEEATAVSRPDQGTRCLRASRHGAGRLQSDCEGPDQERSAAVADRASLRQDGGAGVSALAGSAECRGDPADFEDRTAF